MRKPIRCFYFRNKEIIQKLESQLNLFGKTCCMLLKTSTCTYSKMKNGLIPLGRFERKINCLIEESERFQKNIKKIRNT